MSSELLDQRDMSLPEGVLRLTSLNKDRLILAELADGAVTLRQLRKALGEAGVKHGIIERGVNLILADHDGQVPIARAEVLDLPAQTTEVGLDLPLLDEVVASGKLRALEKVDVSYPVKAGQLLLTVDSVPRTVLRFPNGKERVLKEHEGIDPGLFAGENAEVGKGGKEVVAAIDGLAQRSIYGKISVYASERSGGIGKAHGKVYKETALAVEQDISDGADIETTSSLTVRGAVHGAVINAGGNLHVQYAVDNRTRNKEARLVAGQSLRVRSIEHTPVWVGANFISTQGILQCDVECMDTVAANM
ncbi:MAG: FapA family protein, partial [Candidatus Neomarinimicrobiota bacterium]